MDDSGSRLKDFLIKEGIEQNDVAEFLQITPQYINAICQGRKNVSKKFASALQDKYGVNAGWLLTGDGNMMKDEKTPLIHPDVVMVPVYNLDARGGFGENDELAPEYVTEHMPFSRSIARDGDVVIPIYSDSMTPKFPSGSFVLIRNIQMWREYIEYGASYVLEFMDGRRVIKNIQRSKEKNNFLLESVNPKYEPTDVPKTMIRRIFQVLMSVKRETL